MVNMIKEKKKNLGNEVLMLGWPAWAASGLLRLAYLFRTLSNCAGGNCKQKIGIRTHK